MHEFHTIRSVFGADQVVEVEYICWLWREKLRTYFLFITLL